jgi:aldose 1-epimerase
MALYAPARTNEVARVLPIPVHLMASHLVELRLAGWRLSVDPLLGGCAMGLWLDETPILRPASAGATHAGQSAAFPLVPYSNRIGQGRLRWEGENYTLSNGFDTEPHALHGVGFMRAWTVVERSAQALLLRLVHAPDAYWPFAFEAEQRFELLGDGLRYTLRARNTDYRSQPMGLGWHPYFVRRPSATLDLPVHTHWIAGDDVLPREPKAVGGLRGSVEAMRLDHCFEGAGSVALMADAELRTALQADSRYWVVYTPADADFFCVEPVTHLNNAVQQAQPLAHGLVVLAPGEAIGQSTVLRSQRST